MKRLVRILLNTALVLSLLLFLASGALWIRSYCLGEQISWRTEGNSWFVTSGHGEVMVVAAKGDAMTKQGMRWNHVVLPPFPALPTTGFNLQPLFLGFQSGRGNITPEMTFRAMAMPWWPITLISGALMLTLGRMRFVRRRRERRKRTGCCVRCGYDLRATPEVCPECGTASGMVSP